MSDPVPLTRARLLARGISEDRIAVAIARGRIVPLARGIYLNRHDFDALDDVGRHRVLARQVGAGLEPGQALSHVSAAIVHGFDLWNVDLRRIHVSGQKGRISRNSYRHQTVWEADDIVDAGVPVTSVARTVVDLARTLPFEQAVVAGDSALRLYPSVRDPLPAVLDAARGRTGSPAARAVTDFLDGRSESVGESRSRVRIAEYGLPRPALQRTVELRDGRVYRLDFLWDDDGVVGEFDGLGKYDDRRDVIAEKLREDALRDLGFEVIRWTWADLDRFDVVAERFGRATQRGQRA